MGATAAVNGIELAYESFGEGEPLVLLHGGVSAETGGAGAASSRPS